MPKIRRKSIENDFLLIFFYIQSKGAAQSSILMILRHPLLKAADGNRTRDLRTTNATLYRLSHSSLFHLVALANLVYIIMGNQICQQHF